MTGKVNAVTVEQQGRKGSEYVASLVYTHTDGTKLTAQAGDKYQEIAEAKAIVDLREQYKRKFPTPLRKIVKTLEVDFDA